MPALASRWFPVWTGAAMAAGVATFSLVFVAAAAAVSPWIACVLAIGGAASLLIVGRPFLGVWLIFATVQQIGWTGPLFRGYYSELMTLLILAGILIGSYRRRRNERLVPDCLGTRLTLVLLISMWASVFVADSLGGAVEHVVGLSAFLLLLLLVVREAGSVRRVQLLAAAAVLSMAVSSSTGIVDYVFGTSLGQVKMGQQREEIDPNVMLRFSGSASEATNSSKMMLLAVGISAMMALRGARGRGLYALATVVGILGIAAAGSRGTTVVVLVAVLWLGWKYLHSRVLPIIVVTVLALTGLTIWFMPEGPRERILQLSEPGQDSGVRLRWAMNKIGLTTFAEHPLLGVGPGEFGLHFQDSENRFVPGYTPAARPLHNMYLAVAVEHGVVAIVALVGLILVALTDLEAAKRSSDRDLSTVAEAVQFGLTLYLMAAVFDPVHQQRMVWIVLGLALAVGRVARMEAAAPRPLRSVLMAPAPVEG